MGTLRGLPMTSLIQSAQMLLWLYLNVRRKAWDLKDSRQGPISERFRKVSGEVFEMRRMRKPCAKAGLDQKYWAETVRQKELVGFRA